MNCAGIGGKVKELAAVIGATPGQLARAWVLAKGGDLVPLLGTKRRKAVSIWKRMQQRWTSRFRLARLMNRTASFHPM
jgi:hypothetical protein